MSTTMERESTEFLYFGSTGQPPSIGVEVAFLAAGQRPQEDDWQDAIVVTSTHPLWDDAKSSGVKGDYYAARLVGPYGDNDVILPPGDYQPWVRITDATEQPVRVAPIALEIL